jgi:hypothetical protein
LTTTPSNPFAVIESGGSPVGETVNIVEAKVLLIRMRQEEQALPIPAHTDHKEREQRWYLRMNILSYQMAIDKHEGTYRSPF